jgi:hypothetical protein
MVWSRRSVYGIHCDIVNPRRLKLEAAQEMLAELYDIQISEVDDLILQHIADFRLTGVEFELYISARRPSLS